MNKKAILVVSFGTSFQCQLKSCIEETENKIKDTFKEFEVRRAFTSNMIIKKLKDRDNIEIDTVKEALDKLKEDNFKEVYVQPLHIIYGEEYDKIKSGMNNYKECFEKLELGTPLLYNNEDYFEAVKALKAQIPENQLVLLMAHGTAHKANSAYFQFEYVAKKMGLDRLLFATVEGYPLIEDVLDDLKAKELKEVTLMPLMLVAGDHAKNDMASDDEDSWKSVLEKEGFKVNTYLKGLGENKNFQKIYIKKIKDLIK
ncbi:sirohydrochlorin cobaltochelatase [Clostridium senegalense]|uniref:sirohydrochlorin cobaltochelatase n=1 Tax=Clostridium senegalense TaxID=1465809 RepID=UPI001C10E976|nr:sirohydrochlorin cobaltochelatase [Clostridium senegalense]MBU5227689.1 sirohydrochlorin cobaltochelatase [Clostridium senegalense]